MTEKVLAAIKGNGTMETTLMTSSALQRFGDPKEVFCGYHESGGWITNLL